MSLENLHRDLSESFEMSLCHKNVFCTLSAEDNLVTMKTLSAAWVLDECAVNCQVKLLGDAVTRCESSVETPLSPLGRREIISL